jgi:hypothetical protein
MAASFLAVKFLYGNKKVSRTFNNKFSQTGHPGMGYLLEIRAILFNPGTPYYINALITIAKHAEIYLYIFEHPVGHSP